MSKRLQVLLDEKELAELQEIAQRNHMSLAEWVRQVLRQARLQQPVHSAPLKRQALRKAMEYEFPTADIE
jgi:hypothetical protein